MKYFEVRLNFHLKLVPKGPIDNKLTFVQVMAWCRTDDRPLPEPVMTQFNDAYIRHPVVSSECIDDYVTGHEGSHFT